jgi:hypothetical protein
MKKLKEILMNIQLIAQIITTLWPLLDRAIDKVLDSTAVDEKAKGYFKEFNRYGTKILDQTQKAIELAEKNRNTITDGVVFKFGRILKLYTIKANNLVLYIETNFGTIDLDANNY